MYDHNTQRPRGFGFITYDSEEAVDKVLFKTFHELNGKMVEVKRAVPKELSPGPLRSPSNYGLNRMGSILSPGCNSSSLGGYGMRTEGQFSPFTVGRNVYPQYSPSNHSVGLNLDSGFSLNYEISWDPGLSYVNGTNSYYSGNSRQYGNPVAYDLGNGGSGSLLSSSNQSMWGNGNHTYGVNTSSSNDFIVGSFGSIGEIWGSSPLSGKGAELDSMNSSNIVYGNGYYNFEGRAGSTRNNGGTSGSTLSYSLTNNIHDGDFGGLYDESFKGDHAWRSSSSELQGSAAFGYGRGSASAKVASDSSADYAGGCGITASARSNRGKHHIPSLL